MWLIPRREQSRTGEKCRHKKILKKGGLFRLKSRISYQRRAMHRKTGPIKVMNTIGTQVLMADGTSRRRFFVNSAGVAVVAGLPLVIVGTETNQSCLNEDLVQGGQGFGTHPHRDLEVIIYVVSGALKYEDSMGHSAVMKAGDVQRISTGNGIAHSEFNNSLIKPVHFLQIWLLPSHKGLPPGYAQQSFANAPSNALTVVCSPDGREQATCKK
jgi:uncharacterized RmlC-like cupin family protein